MLNFIKLLTTILIFCLLSIDTFGQSESEPNDDFGSANIFSISGTVQGNFDDSRDVDYYSLEVSVPGLLTVLLDFPSEVEGNLRLYSPENREIEGSGWFSGRGYLDELLCSPGKYYLVISRRSGATPSGNYSLTTKYSIDDVFECNNSIETAASVALNSTIRAKLFDEEDDDFYALEIIEPGVLTFWLTELPEETRGFLRLYSPEKKEIEGSGFFNGSKYMDELVCDPGTYYLKVELYGGVPVDSFYTLAIGFNTDDVFECNNSIETAASVALNSTIRAKLFDEEDDDFYALEIIEPGVLTFWLTELPEETRGFLRLYSPEKKEIEGSGFFNGSKYMDELVCDPGTYYLKVELYGGVPVDSFYTLAIGFNTDDVFECNNSIETAASVALNSTIRAKLFDEEDDDFYALEIIEPGVLTFWLTELPEETRGFLRLYSPEKKEIEGSGFFNGSKYMDELVCDPGTYYLKVELYGGVPVDSFYTLAIGFNTDDVFECNNSIETAASVALNSTIRAKLFDEEDDDFYALEIIEPGVLTFWLTELPEETRGFLRLYSPEKKEIEGSGFFNGSKYMDELVCDPGTYYLKVELYGGVPVDSFYTLAIGFNTDDVFECNNSIETAANVALNSTIRAKLFDEEDDDFYALEIIEPGVLTFWLTELPEETRGFLRLYSPEKKEIEGSGFFNGSKYMDELVCDPGTYYLKVELYGGVPVDSFYTLAIGFNTDDVFECNNQFEEAAPIELNTEIQAHLADEEDIDFFIFKIEEPKDITLCLIAPDGIRPRVRVSSFNNPNSYLVDMTVPEERNLSAALSLESPGQYYVQIIESNRKSSFERYRLLLTTANLEFNISHFHQKIRPSF
jgi:hypothetical protein